VGEWSASRPGHFTLGENVPGILCTGDWVGPKAGIVVLEKIKSLLPPNGKGNPSVVLSFA
jgi:hypothetical protein